jgi:hypothetical protein
MYFPESPVSYTVRYFHPTVWHISGTFSGEITAIILYFFTEKPDWILFPERSGGRGAGSGFFDKEV